jgi:hypothetical protein
MGSKLKTLLEGSTIGVMAAGIGGAVLSQAGCDFSDVQWMEMLGLLFGGPQAVAAWQAKRAAPTEAPKA